MKKTTNREKVIVFFEVVMIMIFFIFLLASFWELFNNGFSYSFIIKGCGTIIKIILFLKILMIGESVN